MLRFPAGVWPTSVMFDIESSSRSGGQSVTGSEQIVGSTAGRWRATASFTLRTEEAILNWRGFRAGLDGRAGVFEVSPFDYYRPRDINGRKVSGVDHASLNKEILFADGSAFGQQDMTYATLAANAAMRSTRISINVAAFWMAPRPGQYFGIDGCLYIATGAYRATNEGPVTIDFRPPLRAPATAGVRVVTDRPTCKMRLTADGSGSLELAYGRWGSTSLEMVEVF